jgi:hypothetical protein
MFWLGIIIGFAAGVVVVTLCYTPLVEKVKVLEQSERRYRKLMDEAIATLKRYERDNAWLASDLEQMERLLPSEAYARFFDAPYKS